MKASEGQGVGSARVKEKERHERRKGSPETAPSPNATLWLEGLNVFGLPAFGAFDDVELHALAFLERTEAVGLNGGVMHEDILAAGSADKTEAL